MLYMLSQEFHQKNPARFMPDDFVSIGHGVFMRCLHKWDPERNASFSTYFMTACRRTFINHATRERFLPHRDSADFLAAMPCTGSRPDRQCSFRDALDSLRGDAKELAQTVLECPVDLAEAIASVPLRSSVRKLIREHLGWDTARMYQARRELVVMLNI